MTNEQLEKQISEEFDDNGFELWFRQARIYKKHRHVLDTAYQAGFNAAALPLMKKIEELEKARDYWKFQYDGENADYIKLQKENEELDRQLSLTKKEKSLAINSLKEINRHLSDEEHVDSGWIKDVIEIQSSSYVETVKLQKENEELRVKLNTCKNDYWFMTNLLEKYSTDKNEAIKDCIERMKFRKPMFNLDKEGGK